MAKGRRGKSHRKLLHIKWLPVSPPEGKLARVVVLTNYYEYVEEHLEDRLRESGVVWMNYASNLFLNSREYLRQHEEGAFEHPCKVFLDKMIDKCRAINAIALKYLSNMIESDNLPSMQAIDAIRAQEDC